MIKDDLLIILCAIIYIPFILLALILGFFINIYFSILWILEKIRSVN
jgi:hypothetical protein